MWLSFFVIYPKGQGSRMLPQPPYPPPVVAGMSHKTLINIRLFEICRRQTPSPWHADAVGGRPPHHPIQPIPSGIANGGCGAGRAIPAAKAECPERVDDRDRGTPRDATPPTPPGIRVTYHGGSTGLSLDRDMESGEADRVEVAVWAVLVGPPGVLTCARTPLANGQRPLH